MDRIRKQNEEFMSAMTEDIEAADSALTTAPDPTPRKGCFPDKTNWVPPDTRREIFDGGREIGQFEGLDFARKIITGVQIGKLAYIKEHFVYRLSGFKTWDNFCEQVLGVSRRAVDEKITLLSKFGAEFFDAARLVSLNRQTLRDLKALPDDVMKDVVKGKSLVIDGEEIPLEEDRADEINAAVAALVAKYHHTATEEAAHAAIAAKDNLKLKRELEKRDAKIRELTDKPLPKDWIDPLVSKAVELCSEAVTRIDCMSQAVMQVDDAEVRERIFAFALSNLDRAVFGFQQAISGVFVVPGVTDAAGD